MTDFTQDLIESLKRQMADLHPDDVPIRRSRGRPGIGDSPFATRATRADEDVRADEAGEGDEDENEARRAALGELVEYFSTGRDALKAYSDAMHAQAAEGGGEVEDAEAEAVERVVDGLDDLLAVWTRKKHAVGSAAGVYD